MSSNMISRIIAAGTAHTNSTDEAVLASYTLAGYAFQPGKAYGFSALVQATATNSTDTLAIRIRLGPTTLTGTAMVTSAAVDVADADFYLVEGTLLARDVDSSSTVWGQGIGGFSTTGESAAVYANSITTLDLTVANLLELTADWSVASAGNSCRAERFEVFEIT